MRYASVNQPREGKRLINKELDGDPLTDLDHLGRIVGGADDESDPKPWSGSRSG